MLFLYHLQLELGAHVPRLLKTQEIKPGLPNKCEAMSSSKKKKVTGYGCTLYNQLFYKVNSHRLLFLFFFS
jgi:hypothetical protein